jgi:hypothetical protein
MPGMQNIPDEARGDPANKLKNLAQKMQTDENAFTDAAEKPHDCRGLLFLRGIVFRESRQKFQKRTLALSQIPRQLLFRQKLLKQHGTGGIEFLNTRGNDFGGRPTA